jgi:hypothetical protein
MYPKSNVGMGTHTFPLCVGSPVDYQSFLIDWCDNNRIGLLICRTGSTSWFGGPPFMYSDHSLTINTWHHVELVRSGTNLYLFLNGHANITASGFTGSVSLGSNSKLCLLRHSHDSYTSQGLYMFNGNIDDIAIYKGIALHTSDFTVSNYPVSVSAGLTISVNQVDADKLDGQHGSYYAPIDSPSLTGTPVAPTPSAGDNSTKISTTAFVQNELINYSIPGLSFTDDLLPTMTSDSAPSPYVVSASSYFNSSYAPWKAKDGLLTTVWASENTTPPWWWQADLGSAKLVTVYAITNQNTNTSNPDSWVFAGSNNGTNWTTLDTRTDVTWQVGNQTKSFSCQGNTTSYRYYRITISKSDGHIDTWITCLCVVGLYEGSATVKADDADKLDGQHASEFAGVNHVQAVDKGGTGAITAQAAIDALTAAGTAGNDGKFLGQDTDHSVKLLALPTIPTAYTSTPAVESGAGNAGSSAQYAKGDHVHPAAGGSCEWSDQTTYLKPATDGQNVRVYNSSGAKYSGLNNDVLLLGKMYYKPAAISTAMQLYCKGVSTATGMTGAIPQLSSNTSASPVVVTASADTTNAYYLCDRDTGTMWNSATLPCSFTVDFGSGTTKAIVRYEIVLGGNGSYPTQWTFSGSNDNSNWTTLNTVTNGSNTATVQYNVDTYGDLYRYYKINFTAAQYNQVYLKSLTLYEADTWTMKALMPDGTEKTVTLT